MIDIIIPSIYGPSKPHRNNKNLKRLVLKGKIVSVRKTRSKIDQTKPRKNDESNSKALIIIVNYNARNSDLVNKKVEIRII